MQIFFMTKEEDTYKCIGEREKTYKCNLSGFFYFSFIKVQMNNAKYLELKFYNIKIIIYDTIIKISPKTLFDF